MWRHCVRPPNSGRRLPLLRCASGSISTLARTPNACRHQAPASSVLSAAAGAPDLCRLPTTTTIEARRPFVSSRPATDQQPDVRKRREWPAGSKWFLFRLVRLSSHYTTAHPPLDAPGRGAAAVDAVQRQPRRDPGASEGEEAGEVAAEAGRGGRCVVNGESRAAVMRSSAAGMTDGRGDGLASLNPLKPPQSQTTPRGRRAWRASPC